MAEPYTTALLLTVFAGLLASSVLLSRLAGRASVPLALLYLGIGMLAGSEGLGGLHFESYAWTFRIGTVSLVLILFDGGLHTPLGAIKEALGPAAVLATVGVAATAALVAVLAHLFGLGWGAAMLLGAVVSSTDAAAVFAVLRGSGMQLKRRVGATLELESGLNDPMAVILTVALTGSLAGGGALGWRLLLDVLVQLAVGTAAGLLFGWLGRVLLGRLRLRVHGLWPVLTTALAFAAFGVPTLFQGSGFLAVYVGGMVLGNGALPYRSGLYRVHDALAWFSQVAMFLMLGLLVYPSRLFEVGWIGLALGLSVALIARPAAVLFCLWPFGYRARELAYICWTGLRGAVPIILATFPILARVPGAHRVFDLVFFIVVVNAVVPGSTVRWVTRRLGLESGAPPPPAALLEIVSARPLKDDVIAFYVSPASAVAGATISDLPFPEGAAALLIIRGEELIAPRGATRLSAGDHVYIFCRRKDRGFLQLLFGQAEEEE
ncbi:MAG TPA: potassium/proton antiporter [Polyangia bacterium]|jgi:cell volume regulation protein A